MRIITSGGALKTMRMTAAQALVRFLAAQHVERDGETRRFYAGVWGIFGHGNVAGLGQALEELGGEVGLPFYRPQNEQGMVHVAAGYAKASARMATFACTSSIGPGATNLLTGAAAATVNRLPVLLLPSDYFASRAPDPVLQQLEHPIERDVSVNDAFRPVSRYFDRVMRPEQLLESLPEATRVLTDPVETGAVTISLPEDVQTEAAEFPAEFFEARTWRIRRPPPEPALLEASVRLIREAARPLLVCGGGVIYSGASDALAALAAGAGIPVAETQAGKGALPWDHPWNVGPIGANGGLAANRLAREADLVIAVGTRLGDFATASRSAFQDPDVKVIGLNVAPFDAHKLGAVALVGDARAGLEALTEALRRSGRTPDGGYARQVAALRAEWAATVDSLRAPREGTLTQAEVIGQVNEAAGTGGVVICAAGSMPGDLLKLWRASGPGSYHLEYGYSTMGYEIPGGMGVKLADPERDVFVMIGDGSYLMLNSELVTAVQDGIGITVVLVDNGGYQSIHGLQRSVGSPSFGNELRARNPDTGRLDGERLRVDFVAHARALGVEAVLASDRSALTRALAEAKGSQSPRVIVVPVDPAARVPSFEGWWDVPVAEASRQSEVREARAAYERARRKQRRHWRPAS